MVKLIVGIILIFICIMLILMIGNAVMGFIESIGIAIEEFLLNSVWGILAIIALGISIFFFIASIKTYPQVREKGRVINAIAPLLRRMDSFFETINTPIMSKSENSIDKSNNEENVIDLSKVDLQSMVRQLAIAINKPNPVFFKGWGNRRLELDVERVHIIKDYIDAIRSAGDSFLELQADAVFSFEKIEELVKIKRNELKKISKQSKLDLDFLNEEYAHKVEMMILDRKDKEEDVKLKRAQREAIETDTKIRQLKAEAEYKLMIAKGTKEEQIALLMAQAVKYYKDLPNVLKSYVTVQLGSDNSQNPDTDMELQDRLKDFIVRKHEAETKKLEYETEENEAEKDTHILKLEREKKKYTGNGNV